MKKLLQIWFLLLFLSCYVYSQVTVTINTLQERKPISPYIYGVNQDLSNVNATIRRMGGNRMTGYNWENNYSNAGSDWYHSSDDYIPWYLGIPESQRRIPGIALMWFHNQSLQQGAKSIITLQMAGYVAKDGNGTVSEAETAPSARWCEVKFKKNGPLNLFPDLNDNYVYMDECVNLLINTYGLSTSTSGIFGYILDNEPGLWPYTHPRIHPSIPTCVELIQKSTTLATVIKDLDPNALVIGYEPYGFMSFLKFQDAPDWEQVKSSQHRWFIDYYLQKFKEESDRQGRRLLDVLSIHWYPEAQSSSGIRITSESDVDRDISIARVQAPRTLWDPNYKTSVKGQITNGENSWINQWFPEYLPLLPNIQQSIDTFYPGTKLAVTEFNYGGKDHISGGIALADVLGIFGKYGVYIATRWGDDGSYVAAAYNIYLNYNGVGGKFGDTSVKAETSNVADVPVYASIEGNNDNKLHIIVINRNYDNNINVTFQITAQTNYQSAEVWGFDSTSAQIIQRSPVSNISNNTFTYTIPKFSVYHFVLSGTQATNNPPTKPQKPQGPTYGYRYSTYTFTTSATDPDGDMIQYVFDWGDGNISTSTLFYSGATGYAQHFYILPGTYTIKVKAVDTKFAESDWSEPFTIYISSEIMIYKPKYVVYDGETSTTNFSSGGGWAAPSGSTIKEVTTEYNSYNHSIELSLTWDNWWGGAGYNWAGWWKQDKILNLEGFESIEFWIKIVSLPTNAKIQFQLKDSTNTLSNAVDIMPYLGDNYIGVWKKVEISLDEFSGIDFSKVWEVQIGVTGVQTGSAVIYIDDIAFVYKTSQQLPNYRLTVNVSPSGAGSVVLEPSGGVYVAGTTVTLTAQANIGYVFNGWSGDLSGSQNPATILMNSNKTVTANFVQQSTTTQTYTLTVYVFPQAAGSVTLSPAGGRYQGGTQVRVVAVANEGYVFDHWEGDLVGNETEKTVIMDSNKTVIAVFVSSSLPQLPQIDVSLTNNEIISGIVNITVSITTSVVNIEKVLLYIDNVCISTDTLSPYSFELNTTKYSDGQHTVRVEVYDEYGRVIVKEIIVEINNTVPPYLLKPTELKNTIVLSPNGDGINDEIVFSTDIEEFKIYNLKGKLIERVEGKFDIKSLKKGVYIYIAKLKNGEVIKGNIIIEK